MRVSFLIYAFQIYTQFFKNTIKVSDKSQVYILFSVNSSKFVSIKLHKPSSLILFKVSHFLKAI